MDQNDFRQALLAIPSKIAFSRDPQKALQCEVGTILKNMETELLRRCGEKIGEWIVGSRIQEAQPPSAMPSQPAHLGHYRPRQSRRRDIRRSPGNRRPGSN